MAGDSEPFHKTERRKELRLFEEHLGENFFVKQIQAPGPEPDEVDEKNGEPDHQEGDDSQRPFQNASKHVQSVAPPPLSRSILYECAADGLFPWEAQAASLHCWAACPA